MIWLTIDDDRPIIDWRVQMVAVNYFIRGHKRSSLWFEN